MHAIATVLCLGAVAGPALAQAGWARLYPTTSPTPRVLHAMAFDAARGVCVSFGGYSPPGENAQTWRFDGTDWALAAVVGPSARQFAQMVFDSDRNVAVLFGGTSSGAPQQDTWEWNGSAWLLRSSAIRPSPRGSHAMAYDPIRHRTVLFGGWSGSSGLGDTWTWDGSAWLQRTPAQPPAPRHEHAMAFDPNSGGILLFGGAGGSGSLPVDDTWRWDGVGWQQLQPQTLPYARYGHSMTTDVARRRVVLLGGILGPNTYDPLAWEWDGQGWQPRFVASPAGRVYAGLAYDSVRREVVLFGGAGTVNYGDTWVYRTGSPAEFAPLGAGCAGSLGTPALTNAPYSLPWLGDLFTSQVAPVASNGPVFFVTGNEAVPPLALAPFGMPGCTLFVSILATDLRFANGSGVASWSLQIPNAAALAGVELAQQCLSLDSGNAAGAVVSSARTLRIGIR